MPATKRNKNGPVTRSQKASDKLDITTYTTLNAKPDKPIQVVSKRGLKSDPKVYEELEKKFERIEAKRKQQEAEQNEGLKTEKLHISPEIWDRRNTIFFITHFNVFLYATCFFIQVGTMPVRLSLIILPYKTCWDCHEFFT